MGERRRVPYCSQSGLIVFFGTKCISGAVQDGNNVDLVRLDVVDDAVGLLNNFSDLL